jgi:hypothetical protein
VEDEPPAQSAAPAEQPRMRAVPEPDETANVTELRVPQKAEPEPEVAKPEVAESVPAEPVPAEDSSDDEDVEVVDAVAVEDEPDRRNGAPAAKQQAASEPRGFDGDDMLAARLVALQMAVAGSARVEVEAHLRKTFALDEPGAILNDVFGAESKL